MIIFHILHFKIIQLLEYLGNKQWHFVIGEPTIKTVIKNLKEIHWLVTLDYLPRLNGSMQHVVVFLQEPTRGEGPYLMNDRGCFLANFKPLRGDYAVDQAVYTVEAKSYLPNDYNLYNMAGNVAEWTNSSYDTGAYDYVASLSPNMSLKEEQRKVVRGGSWKDVAYFLRVSSRDFEYADTSRSYIGFRTVQDYLGTPKVKIR